MPSRSPRSLLQFLMSKPVVELADLQAALDGASRATVFRYLRQVPYRSSYTHRGRYYTLHNPSKYDRLGLFSVGEIHFSVDGTVKATVVRMIRESEQGCSQHELREWLRTRVRGFLLDAWRAGLVKRDRLGGVYVYFHPDPEVWEAQLHRRQECIAAARAEAAVDDEVVIRVLLVLLRHLGAQAGEVVRYLKGRSPPITRDQVDVVFARYGLDEKGGPRIY